MRKFKFYCVEVSDDGSEFELVFELDGKIIDKKTEYSFNDVLIDAYEFFHSNCEKYNFDSRRDKLEVNLDYKF